MTNLDTLLKVALSATPGPWKAEPYLYGMTGEGCRIRVTSPSTDDLHNLADDVLREDAEFIATFDPPTVLALLSRLEQAERKASDNYRLADELLTDRDYWEDKLTNLVYSLATEEEVGEWSSMNDIADNLIEHIGGKMQKLEQAEQALARVREIHWKRTDRVGFYADSEEPIFRDVCGYCNDDSVDDGLVPYPCDTIIVLDGGLR